MALRPVYSSELIEAVLSDGGTAIYNVLPLTVVLVQDVVVTVDGILGGDMVFILGLGLGASIVFWHLPPTWWGMRHWHGKVVLEPGGVLTASWAESNALQTCHVQVSGETLTNP